MVISINKCSEEIKEKVVKDYLNNKSLRQLYLDKKYERFKELLNKYSEN